MPESMTSESANQPPQRASVPLQRIVRRRLPTRAEWNEVLELLGPTGNRPIETVLWVLQKYRQICATLQECVQKHHLGLGGEHIDTLAVEEIDRLRAALQRIRNYPVHSEPVGGAMAMQDIAHEALNLNTPNDSDKPREKGST